MKLTTKGTITMIRENAVGRNSCQCIGLRYIGKFLMPIVSVCCLQAWAEELESTAPGGTNTLTVAETYTATQDQDLTFGALQVEATPVTFDFSATPTRKVVFDGSSQNAFVVNKKNAMSFLKVESGVWLRDLTVHSIAVVVTAKLERRCFSITAFGRICIVYMLDAMQKSVL